MEFLKIFFKLLIIFLIGLYFIYIGLKKNRTKEGWFYNRDGSVSIILLPNLLLISFIILLFLKSNWKS